MIGIIARVSTLEAAVNPAITLLPKLFITACTAKAHTATNEWFSIAGIAIFVMSCSNPQSNIFSNFSDSNFFNLRSNTTTASVVAIVRDTTVAHAAHAIHRWNLITNNKSKHILTTADMIKNCNGVLESHRALNVDVAISYTNSNVVHRNITCKYSLDHAKISDGVCNKFNIGQQKQNQIILVINHNIHADINAVYADFFTSFIFFAPKSWDMMTLAHAANQIGIEINRKNIGKAAHTDAKAFSDINLPTMTVSAIL